MPMPDDTFTNTPEDAAAYERERAESAGEVDDDRAARDDLDHQAMPTTQYPSRRLDSQQVEPYHDALQCRQDPWNSDVCLRHQLAWTRWGCPVAVAASDVVSPRENRAIDLAVALFWEVDRLEKLLETYQLTTSPGWPGGEA